MIILNSFGLFFLCFVVFLLAASSNLPVDFLEAAKSGNLSALEDGIQLGVDPSDMSNALELAIENNHLSVVDRLLQEENLVVPREAFRLAVSFKNPEIIERLQLDERIEVNYQSNLRDFPFHRLIKSGLKELFLKILNDPRMDVNKLNSDGQTVLHLAAMENDRDLVSEILKRSDIKVNWIDCYCWTALDYAILQNHLNHAFTLLNDPRIDFERVKKIEEYAESLSVKMRQVVVIHRLAEINPDFQFQFFGETNGIIITHKFNSMEGIRIRNVDLLRQFFEAGNGRVIQRNARTQSKWQDQFYGSKDGTKMAHKKRLAIAIKSGNIELLRQLIELGIQFESSKED